MKATEQKRCLWIGDAVATTGFEHCTRAGVEALLAANWDVHVLGISYLGDPHDYGCPVYPGARFMRPEDAFGNVRSGELVASLKPDVVVIVQDPWNIPDYMVHIRRVNKTVPVVGWLAVDGKNQRGSMLSPTPLPSSYELVYAALVKAGLVSGFRTADEVGAALKSLIGDDPASIDYGLALAVFWTAFAEREARKGGYTGRSAVVPLGVDLDVFKPTPRADARAMLRLPENVQDGFIVGVVGRNQPRKHLDLAISYFAEWVKTRMVDDAFLMIHVAPTQDTGWDLAQLRDYYGLGKQVILSEPEVHHGIGEREMAVLYSAMDCLLSTSSNEGWNLPAAEAMACSVPCILPDQAGPGEWARDAALLVPCSEICHTPNTINAEGAIPDRAATVKALDLMYTRPSERALRAKLGRQLVEGPSFRWENVGAAMVEQIESVLVSAPEAVEAVA